MFSLEEDISRALDSAKEKIGDNYKRIKKAKFAQDMIEMSERLI